jgi:hypothetical protein
MRTVSTSLERIKGWFGRLVGSAEDRAGEGTPDATPAPGSGPSGLDDDERETSTNAQMEGAEDEPWPGNT